MISPVESAALFRPHGLENLHLLLSQVLETGPHQSHLLTPHLRTDDAHLEAMQSHECGEPHKMDLCPDKQSSAF